MNFRLIYTIVIILSLFTACEPIPLLIDTEIRYSTLEQMEIRANADWTGVGLAKEIVNPSEQLVFVGLGENEITQEEWDDFEVRLPWAKNIDRNILFDSSYVERSPSVPADCDFCVVMIEFKGYTWGQLAQIKGLTYIPDETDTNKPEAGYLAIKTINKCQAIRYNEGATVYDLTDNNGNYYIMHATEDGSPTTDVELPEGWSISSRVLDEAFILSPFGGGDNCFYNVVGDHLGQGYHQYIYSSAFFPE